MNSFSVVNGGLDSLFGKLYVLLNCSLVCMLWTMHFAVLIKKRGSQKYEYSNDEAIFLQLCLRIIEKPSAKYEVSFSF